MAKQRRPRGPRSTWQSKPPLDQEPVAEPALPDEPAPVAAAPVVEPEAEPAPAVETAAHEAVADPAPPVEAVEAEEPVAASEPEGTPPSEPAEALAAEPVVEAPAPAEIALPEAIAAAPEPIPAPAPVTAVPVAIEPAPPFVTAGHKLAFRFDFTPEAFDATGISGVIVRYMRGESDAAAAHMRALSQARSPADVIRLQVGEFQRAADASLVCWSTVAHKVSRVFAAR